MKKRSLFAIIIISLLCLSLIACGGGETCKHANVGADGVCADCGETVNDTAPQPCEKHTDANSDSKCDVCGETVTTVKDGEILLIENSTPKFQIVKARGANASTASAIDSLIEKLNARLGESVKLADDNVATVREIEILIGEVSSRGDEYKIDPHYLGYKGFTVRAIGNKVVVLGGSDDTLVDAIEYLEKEIFGIKKAVKPIETLILTKEMMCENIQDDYVTQSVSIAGKDIDNYVFAINKSDKELLKLTQSLQEVLYKAIGAWLDIEEIRFIEDAQNAIYIENLTLGDERSTEEGFNAYVSEGDLHIECEFPNRTSEVITKFISDNIAYSGKKNVTIADSFEYKQDIRNIYYSDFGAKGDGRTDDFEALKATHEYANLYGHTVCSNPGSNYYIGSTGGKSITIMTSVNWGDSKFTIDDSEIHYEDSANRGASIFKVLSANSSTTVAPGDTGIGKILTDINAAGGIDKDNFDKFDLGLGYKAMVFIINANHKNYIRYQSHHASAQSQNELIIIDENGNVDPSTPLLFDYSEVTSIKIYKVDDTPITISGGIFTTVANQVPLMFDDAGSPVYYYYNRGISISRSNVTVTGLQHYIEGELDYGAPYNGFVSISYSSDVLVENTILTAHKNYSNMGSYDIGIGNSNNITYKNVTQSNFFAPGTQTPSVFSGWWGIMGSNFCKNLTYDGCKLTRFDAHCGTYNATIKDSWVAAITLIGGGTFTMENSRVYTGNNASMITLRSDYGSTWRGDFYLKDVTAISNKKNLGSMSILSASWGNWDFGYRTYMPESIHLDNLKVLYATDFENGKETNATSVITLVSGAVALNTGFHLETINGAENLNPYTPTKFIYVKNNTSGFTFTLPTTDPFKESEIINEDE